MKVAISLNEVLRAHLEQLIYTYDKYFFYGEEKKSGIEYSAITDYNYVKLFTKFNSQQELNSFIHLEHPLEINGHADETIKDSVNKLNKLMVDLEDDFNCELEIVSREVDKSIPSTLFFLSKTGCKIKNIRFITENKKEWGYSDILITANPISLKEKPENKISIKISTPYNNDVEADYTYNTLIDFINDKETITKLLNK